MFCTDHFYTFILLKDGTFFPVPKSILAHTAISACSSSNCLGSLVCLETMDPLMIEHSVLDEQCADCPCVYECAHVGVSDCPVLRDPVPTLSKCLVCSYNPPLDPGSE